MNIIHNTPQARIVGIVLIVLGVVAILDLWWLVPAALLAGGGIAIYRRQRVLGRTGEAVQAALWGLGLAFLFLIDAIIPGVLLLGGASLLLRGREQAVEQRAQLLITQVASRRRAAAPAQPVAVSAPQVTIVSAEQPNTSDTVRLR